MALLVCGTILKTHKAPEGLTFPGLLCSLLHAFENRRRYRFVFLIGGVIPLISYAAFAVFG